jgi:hypothetical protein
MAIGCAITEPAIQHVCKLLREGASIEDVRNSLGRFNAGKQASIIVEAIEDTGIDPEWNCEYGQVRDKKRCDEVGHFVPGWGGVMCVEHYNQWSEFFDH